MRHLTVENLMDYMDGWARMSKNRQWRPIWSMCQECSEVKQEFQVSDRFSSDKIQPLNHRLSWSSGVSICSNP